MEKPFNVRKGLGKREKCDRQSGRRGVNGPSGTADLGVRPRVSYNWRGAEVIKTQTNKFLLDEKHVFSNHLSIEPRDRGTIRAHFGFRCGDCSLRRNNS